MSWHYLQDQEEVSSEGVSWDGKQFAPSKSRTTLGKYCLLDSETESSQDSQYGMTLKRSTGDHGEDELMWYQGDSPVRTYLAPEKVQDLPGNDQDCGPRWPGSLARYNPGSYSWKTAQFLLLGDLEPFSGTWPRWGIMRDGECSVLTMPEGLTNGIGSGSWPTPKARDWRSGKGAKGLEGHAPDLNVVIENLKQDGGTSTQQTYPTPTKSMMTYADMEQARYSGNDKRRPKYQDVKYPTPTRSDGMGGPGNSGRQGGENLRTNIGGQLNPGWVEWLMEYPAGWTDLKPLEMDRFRRWQRLHGMF